MSKVRVNNITNASGNSGPTVAGIPEISSNSHFVVPTGRTGTRYADGGENIVRDGLVLYLDAKYSYPGASGTNPDVYTWYDMSGNGNDAELIGNITYSPINGGSLVSPGLSGNRIEIQKQADPSPNEFTGFLWFKSLVQLSTGQFAHLIDNLDYNVDIGWSSSLAHYSPYTGNVSFRYVDYLKLPSSTDAFNILSKETDLDDGNWHCSAYSWNGTTEVDAVKLYVDGNLSATGTSRCTASNRLDNIKLGYGNHTNGVGFNGNYGMFIIYNRALTAEEVLQNYNATKDRFI